MKNIIQLSKTILTLFALLAGSQVTTTLFAQGEQQVEEEQQTQEIKAIPGTKILNKAEEASEFLMEIMAEVSDTEKYDAMISQLPDYKKRIEELKNTPVMQNLTQSSETKIKDLQQKWRGYKKEINDAISKIEDFSKLLQEKRQGLVSLKEVWTLTASTASSEKLPTPLKNRAQKVITEISATELKLRTEIDNCIKIQSRFLDHINEIDKILAQIDKAMTDRTEDYMAIDAEPFWTIFQTSGQFKDFRSTLYNSINDNLQTLVKFYQDFRGRMLIHFISFIIISIGLISIRKFRNEILIDKDFSDWSQNVLNRPYAVATLITLLLIDVFYPLTPYIIIKIAQLIALAAVVRLLPTRHISKVRKYAILFSGLYFLYVLYVVSDGQTFVSRFFLVIITLISIAYLVLLLRLTIFTAAKFKNHFTTFGRLFIKVLSGILFIALISNILGNVSLAVLLTYASLLSIFQVFILFVSSNVIISLINLLLQTRLANMLRFVNRHGDQIGEKLTRFIYGLVSLFFVIKVFDNFKVFDPAYAWISDVVSFRLQIGSMDISTVDVLVFVLAIYASVYVSKFIQFILQEDVFSRMQLPRGIPTTVSLLTKYLIVGLGFMIAISAAGFDISKFAIIFGALGVGIGFGLQNIVNNFISGLILIFERPIQAGDTVAIGDLLGTVTHIGIRASTVRTFDGSEVIVPNGHLIENEVINWTLSDRRRRIEIKIGAAYGTDPEFVLKVLKETISGIPEILKDPEPLMLFQEFGDSSLNFSVRFWTDRFETWLELKSTAAVAINKAFKEAGIVIPFPQRDLHLNTVDTKIIRDIKDNQDDSNL